MIQNLFRSCLVSSISLITFGLAVEVLKPSEFEDKEIPLLLNWKGYKHEKNIIGDSDWWRWAQESKENPVTEGNSRSNVNENSHRLVFKREIQPFSPNIGPLRSLFTSRISNYHLKKKRWITSSFGFGNRKKSQKESKQSLCDVQGGDVDYPRSLANVEHEIRDTYSKVRVNVDPKNYQTYRGQNEIDSTSKTSSKYGNVGQTIGFALHSQVLAPPNRLICTKPYVYGNKPFDNDERRTYQNDRLSPWEQLEQPKRSKLFSTAQNGFFTTGGMSNSFLSMRRSSFIPRVNNGQWAKYTTETNFGMVNEHVTEPHYNRLTMKFHLKEQDVQYITRPSIIGANGVKSLYREPNHLRHLSIHIPKKNVSSIGNFDYIEGEDNFYTQKNEALTKSCSQLDVFDRISIPTVSNSDNSAQLYHLRNSDKNSHGIFNMDKTKHKKGDMVNFCVTSTGNRLKGQRTVLTEEGENYDMLPEKNEPYENEYNLLEATSTKLQAKANKNNNRHLTRDSVIDAVRNLDRSGGVCGNCGGGVNISIMMASHPSIGSTVECNTIRTSRATSAYDKIKKKKERKKKTGKNIVTTSSEPVVASKKGKHHTDYSTEKVIRHKGTHEITIASRNFFKSSGKQRVSNFLNYLQSPSYVNETLYREITSCSEAARHPTPYNPNNQNFSSKNYLDIVQESQHPKPTVSDSETLKTWEEQDDRDELQELYDEQYSKAEDNNKNQTREPYPSYYSGSTSFVNARNHLVDNNIINNVSSRNGTSKNFKNIDSGSGNIKQKYDIKYSALSKMSKESLLLNSGKEETLYEPWMKFAFPTKIIHNDCRKLSFRETEILNEKSRTTISIRHVGNSEFIKQHREQVDDEDQWEALDADFENSITERAEGRSLQVRKSKREVDEEVVYDDSQGYYRLSAGRSLRNPASMIISAIRNGKMNGDKKFLQYEDMLGEEEEMITNTTSEVNARNH